MESDKIGFRLESSALSLAEVEMLNWPEPLYIKGWSLFTDLYTRLKYLLLLVIVSYPDFQSPIRAKQQNEKSNSRCYHGIGRYG
jgi:hypothetical protein